MASTCRHTTWPQHQPQGLRAPQGASRNGGHILSRGKQWPEQEGNWPVTVPPGPAHTRPPSSRPRWSCSLHFVQPPAFPCAGAQPLGQSHWGCLSLQVCGCGQQTAVGIQSMSREPAWLSLGVCRAVGPTLQLPLGALLSPLPTPERAECSWNTGKSPGAYTHGVPGLPWGSCGTVFPFPTPATNPFLSRGLSWCPLPSAPTGLSQWPGEADCRGVFHTKQVF